MKLPKNGSFELAMGEEQRIEAAVQALAQDPHAPRELSVRVHIHVHNEYPKHVKVGEDKQGNAITQIVNSAEEEAALAPAE